MFGKSVPVQDNLSKACSRGMGVVDKRVNVQKERGPPPVLVHSY